MQTVETQQAEETEQQLIDMAAAAVRQSSWTIGEAASKWTERYSQGRTDADFAELIGSSQQTVNYARRIFDRFYQRVGKLDFTWRAWIQIVSWPDADECLDWAEATSATFREMEAWRRVKNGEPLTPEPPKLPSQQAAEPDPPIVFPQETGPDSDVAEDGGRTQPPKVDTQATPPRRPKPETTTDLKTGTKTAIQSLRQLVKQASHSDRCSVAQSLRRLADELDPPTTADMPANLQSSQEFQDAWKTWEQYRKQKRQTLTDITRSRQLAKLSSMGPVAAVQAINRSIEQGWTGIFEANENSGGTVSTRVREKDLTKQVVYRDWD